MTGKVQVVKFAVQGTLPHSFFWVHS